VTAFPARAGNMFVIGRNSTADGITHPVHVISTAGELLRSFGAAPSEELRPDRPPPAWTGAESSGGNAWLVRRSRYELQQWDDQGTLLRVVTRQAAWFPGRDWDDTPRPTEVKPLATIGFVSELGDQHLLIKSAVAASDWAPTVRPARGSLDAPPPQAAARQLYQSLLEIVDVRGGHVVASQRTSIILVNAIAKNLAYSFATDADGFQFIDVWRVELRQP
jgi:hypothetical protein